MLKKAIPMIIVIALIINLGATLSIYAAEINVNSTQLSSSEPIVDNEINIPDINLKAALNKSIDSNREDNQIIRQSELENLTSLDLDNKEIINLDGLEYCKNVVEISLSNNKVSDLTPLKNLINLTKLSLDNNCINDISALKNLNNLNSLSLNNQSINANEIKSTKNLVEVNNIVKIIDGSPVPIVSTDDYIYNSNSNTITFINILENCNKSYSFSTNVSLGKSTTLFSGIVTHKITYTKDTSYNNDIAYNIEDWEYKKNDEAKTIELTKYKEMANKDVKIPDKFNGLEEYTVILNGGIETFPYDITSIETVDTDNNSLTKIKLLSGNSLFKDKTVLTKVNLDWDTSQVTDMKQMFKNLSSNLKELNLNNWDVSNVTNMEEMFYNLSPIEELDLSTWTKVKSDVKLNDFITSPMNPLYIKTSDIDLKNKITQLINSKAIKTYDINLELGNHVTATKNVISKGLIETDEDKKINKNDLEKFLNIDEGLVIDGWYTNAELTDEWDFNTEVTRDITLYPKVSNNDKILIAEDAENTDSVPTESGLYPNTIEIKGQRVSNTSDERRAIIEFNNNINGGLVIEVNIADATSSGYNLHDSFKNVTYFSIKILSEDGEVKLNEKFDGNKNGKDIQRVLNGKQVAYGDIIQLYHRELFRLNFTGNIINGENLTDAEKNDCIFKITHYGLEKCETPTPQITADGDLYIFQGDPITNENMLAGINVKDPIQQNVTNIRYDSISTEEIGPKLVEYTVTNNFGKMASITRTVNIIATTYPTTIKVNWQVISDGVENKIEIKFNPQTKKLNARLVDNNVFQSSFFTDKYFAIKILKSNGQVRVDKTYSNTYNDKNVLDTIVEELNEVDFDYGDTIQLYHAEAYTKLKILGKTDIGVTLETESDKDVSYKITPFGLYRSDWEFTKNDSEKSINLIKYTGSDTDIRIPDQCEVAGEKYNVILNGGNENVFPNNITSVKTVDTDFNSDTKVKLLSGYYLFRNKSSLTQLTLDWDTSQVTTMRAMFNGSNKIETINGVSDWNVSRVTDMNAMFNGLNLSELDLSNWDVSNVTNMGWMFRHAGDLTKLNVSNWNVSNVTNMDNMFYNLGPIEELDLSTWTNVKSNVSLDNFITSPMNSLYIKTSDINLKNKITQLINSKAIKTYDINLELGAHVTATESVISKGLIETDEDKKINKNDLENYLNIDQGFVIDGWYTNAELTNAWDFNTKVTQNITLYPKINNAITYISIPKKVEMKKGIDSEYVESTVNVSISGGIAYSRINVKINPLLELIYKKNKVKVDIYNNNSIINSDGEVGALTKENNNITLNLKAKKASFIYMNKVEYSGTLEFIFSN